MSNGPVEHGGEPETEATDHNEDCEDGSEQSPGGEGSSPADRVDAPVLGEASLPRVGFRLPLGFAGSLTPGADAAVKLLAPLKVGMSAAMPESGKQMRKMLTPFNDQFNSHIASATTSLPTVKSSKTVIPFSAWGSSSPIAEKLAKQIASQQAAMFDKIRRSLQPLFDKNLVERVNRAVLPPNLQNYADEVNAKQVGEFLEQEGIPLFLVPRGRTALRLVRAQDRAARRRVLSDCYESLTVDCSDVLDSLSTSVVDDERGFACDAIGAMRAGYTRSAQAMLTVVLDTLISRFYPDRDQRGSVLRKPKGSNAVPAAIEAMGVHQAMVWLPIWNAHEQFWKDKGDNVPHYYSRHASVHGVSARQFNKRNCVQVLMLVTSLIGYADRLMSSAAHTSA